MNHHVYHFKRATLLAIYTILYAAINSVVIFGLIQYGIPAVYAGYIASGLAGFALYLIGVYLFADSQQSSSTTLPA
jgi:hypothetical protein